MVKFKPTKLHVRQLCKYTVEEIYKNKVYEITFDDKVKSTLTHQEVAIMMIMIKNMVLYDDVEITSGYNIREYYDDNYFTDDTPTGLMTYIYYSVANKHDSLGELDLLRRGIYKSLNDVYNLIGYRSMDAMLSIDILDLIDIANQPAILEAMATVKKDLSVISINNAYNVIDRVIHEYPLNTSNKAVLMFRAKTINSKQLFQIIGPRGFVAETDGSILSTPIPVGYLDGMNNLYNFTAESRTASVALMQADTNIAQSEYFGRRMHMVTMSVEGLHKDDCNSDDLVEWTIKAKTSDSDGNVTYNGDILNMVGKYYKRNKKDIGFRFITGNENFKDGETILLRSVDGCKHNDKHGICKTCFGRLHLNIPFHYNIGHLASTIMTSKLTQKMLSAKHLIMSLFSTALSLEESYRGIFVIREDGFSLDIDNLSKYDTVECLINIAQVNGISNLTTKTNIDNIDTHTLSSVSDVEFRLVKNGKETIKHITIAQDTTTAILTKETLSYITRSKNLSMRDNKYVIDLSRWNVKKNMFDIPSTEYSHFDLMKQIKSTLLKRSVLKGGVSRDNVDGLVKTMFRLVNSKLSVNLAMVEVIVYALTTFDLSKNDYDLARHSTNKQLGNEANILGFRSLGARLGSGRIVKYIFSTQATKKKRPNHALDYIFYKQEAIDTRERRNNKYGDNVSLIDNNKYTLLNVSN